jgi:LPS-assembly protein
VGSLCQKAEAREEIDFEFNQVVKVLSDKQYRITKDNRFEALGNVIISQGGDTIYGEKATLFANSGDVDVEGNVRYIGAEVTLYGSKLKYNFKNQEMEISKARILSDNYVVLGKKISRKGESEFEAFDAEYTTCKDCPESWTIFGKHINVTVGQYIRITHAYIKIKGVVVMYIPYIILPIKNDRESGLLFPKFGLNIEEGAQFQLPWFLAISENADLTVTPSYFGNRGLGVELEARHVIKDGFWYQYDGLYSDDRIYKPGKDDRERSGDKEFRHFSQWEHHYFNGSSLNHHTKYSWSRDLDMTRDFRRYTDDKILSSDIGLESYFDFRTPRLNVSLEGGYRRNSLFNETYEFDNSYVQIQPKVSLTTSDFILFQNVNSYLSRLSFNMAADFTSFKQNHIEEGNYIRNAYRTNLKPNLRADFLNFGAVKAYTQATLDYQYYTFPNEDRQKWFRKNAVIYESGISIEFEKIFGLAYDEKVLVDEIDNRNESTSKGIMLGNLPSIENKKKSEYIVRKKSSYRHGQTFHLKHYFLSSGDSFGSDKFLNQISVDQEDRGLFDPIDIIRSKESLSRIETSKTTLPYNNTIELQWNNVLVKKEVKNPNIYDDNQGLLDNFSYQQVAYFNVSQGYDFYNTGENIKDNLTRLHINTGFTLNNTSFSSQMFYYYPGENSIFNINVSQAFKRGSVGASLRYNSFRLPTDKFFLAQTEFQLSELISLRGQIEHDIEQKRTIRTNYGLTYSPYNNCWKLLLDYQKTTIDKRFSFNFLINFNDAAFQGLQGDQ